MTPLAQRNRLLAETIIRNLHRRHINAYFCPTTAETVAQVNAFIADGSSVTWGGSATIRDIGLPDALRHRGTLEVLDRDLVNDPAEKKAMYLRAFTADVFLTSANAISEDGVIINIDGNGNRVAAITWGPRRVIHVVGLNKVAPTVEAAIARARSVAAPTNAQRFDIETPCRHDGVCHNCTAPESICAYISLLRLSRDPNRHHVVIVGENVGY